MNGNIFSRLGSMRPPIEFSSPLGAAALVRPGRGAGRDHRALLPQAEAAAGPGAQHAALAEEPRGPARQQPVPAAAAQPAALPPAPGRGPGDAGPGRAADQGDGRPGAAVRAHDRQLGQHVGDRRRPQPAGEGQGRGQEGRRGRWTATTWRWSISFAETARVVSNYTGDKPRAARSGSTPSSRPSRPPRSARPSRSRPGWPTPRSRSARAWSPPRP